MSYSREKLKLYLQWDELAWGKCLGLFKKIVTEKGISSGLEIAANKGGISLFFASELGINMLCTDLDNPEERFNTVYKNLSTSNIKFAAINGLDMKLADNSIEMLVFKSFLGGMRTFENQQKAMNEIYRVLKPGGVLLFAENLGGSKLHRFFRRMLVPWGTSWRYITIGELEELIAPFGEKQIETFGFFSAFGKINFLKKLFYMFDQSTNSVLPNSMKYICYGYAIK